MDGTLARFHDEVQYLERMWEKDFFKNLKPFPNLIRAVSLLHKNYPDLDIYILSAAIEGEPPYCKAEKNMWIDRYLPFIDKEHRIFTKTGHSKSEYIPGELKEDDVLFDDYTENLLTWGGLGVKCKNNINCKGLYGSPWKGAIISNQAVPHVIASNLACASKHFKLPPLRLMSQNRHLGNSIRSEFINNKVVYAGYEQSYRVTDYYDTLNKLVVARPDFKDLAYEYISDDLSEAHIDGNHISVKDGIGKIICGNEYIYEIDLSSLDVEEPNVLDVYNTYERSFVKEEQLFEGQMELE